MTPQQQNEVWSMLKRDELAQIAQQGPLPIFASISGAHLYGFASPDSDVDLRGAFMHPAEKMLGLRPPDETITIEENNNIELDWVAHDIRKFCRLLTQHNGYVLEQLYSPLVILSTRAHEELCELAKGCVTRPTVRHYLGFANSRRQRLDQPKPTVKHLLYAYRVLLTGIHMMRTGEVQSNITTLNEDFRLNVIEELVQRKREGREKMELLADEKEKHSSRLDELTQQLIDAHEQSSLPVEPSQLQALDDFVVRIRLQAAAR